MRVICISGKAQHGKDTTAIMLKEELELHGKSVIIVHYADLLKYICRTWFGWNGEKDEKGRTLLQQVGTDVIRKKAPHYWVDFVISILKLFKDKWDYVIIPDTRFPNEIKRLRKNKIDTIYVRVFRPFFDNHLTEEQQKHPSETALDGFTPDYTIWNIEDEEYLKKEVHRFYIAEIGGEI